MDLGGGKADQAVRFNPSELALRAQENVFISLQELLHAKSRTLVDVAATHHGQRVMVYAKIVNNHNQHEQKRRWETAMAVIASQEHCLPDLPPSTVCVL